jgi:regulatory protein
MTEEHSADRGDEGEAPAEAAYAKGLRLLATRAHFTAELAAKLGRRGYPQQAVEEAVERLAAHGYLDDASAARSFARQRATRGGWGPARLRAELGRRRVEAPIVDEVVAETFSRGELPAAEAVVERWRTRGGGDRDRLARQLDRRGFSKTTIVEILSRVEAGESSVHEER